MHQNPWPLPGFCSVGKEFYIECLYCAKMYTNHGSNSLANKASRILRRSYYDNITSETKRNSDGIFSQLMVDYLCTQAGNLWNPKAHKIEILQLHIILHVRLMPLPHLQCTVYLFLCHICYNSLLTSL